MNISLSSCPQHGFHLRQELSSFFFRTLTATLTERQAKADIQVYYNERERERGVGGMNIMISQTSQLRIDWTTRVKGGREGD